LRLSSLRVCLSVALCITIAGCGYSSGVRLPEGVETVAVEYFANDSPVPGIDRTFHQSLSDQVSRMVSAPLTTPRRADISVRGRIIDFRRIAGIIGGKNRLKEVGVRVTVEAWLHDTRLETRLGYPVNLSQEVRYLVRVREEEAGARDLMLATICQELVLELFTQEDYEPEDPR
jgi:hypothetical protein